MGSLVLSLPFKRMAVDPVLFVSALDDFAGASLGAADAAFSLVVVPAELDLSVAELLVSGTIPTSFPFVDAIRESNSVTSDAFGDTIVGPRILRILFCDDAGLLFGEGCTSP